MRKGFKLRMFGREILELRSGDSEPGTFSLKDFSGELLNLFGGKRSQAGQLVNQDTAISFSAVTAGVRIIAETIASLSMNVHQYTKGGNSSINYTHNLQHLLNAEPYHLYTSFVFRELLITNAIMWGNGYAQIIRNNTNKILGFKILKPDTVKPFIFNDELFYKIENMEEPISALDMIHIHGFVKDGIVGIALTDIAKESIGAGLAMQELAAKFFSNGGIFKGVLTTPQALTDKQYARMKDSWNERNTGSDNHWKEPLLEGGLEYKPMTLSPEQSQLLESRKFQLIEIARFLRLPPHKLADLDKSTNNNIEHQSIEFVTDTIRPWIKRTEQEFNRKVFTEREKETTKVRFDLNSLLRGDVAARGEYYSKMFSISAMSPNEIRQKEGLNTYEGGDEYYVQGAFIPTSVIKEKYQASVQKIIEETKQLNDGK